MERLIQGFDHFRRHMTEAAATAQGSGWGGAIAESSYVIGATLTKDGRSVTAWRGFAAEGVPPASIPPSA